MVYICLSNKRLSDEKMIYLARTLGCTVTEIGQVKGKERWDYKFDRPDLSLEEKDILKKSNLEIIIEPSDTSVDKSGLFS